MDEGREQIEREVAELRTLFDLQWKRMADATERWRAENPEARALVMPDLGDLLRWLMDDADRARAGGWYLGRCGNEREPDGAVCTADLYAATRTDVQVQCPECGAWTGVEAPGRLPRPDIARPEELVEALREPTMTAADDLARLVRHRVPLWTEQQPEPALWRFTDGDPDWGGRFVIVDGREGRPCPCVLQPGHYGPTLAAMADGRSVHVDLPSLVDFNDKRRALAVAEAIGALPAPDGTTR